MAALASYVGGRWQLPSAAGTPVRDASTGAEVARVSAVGIDAGAALAYGRAVGGPALRALTFHERGAALKALAGHLRERRDELYDLSTFAGATRADARIDVDGGIGTLLAYASIARRELPNDTVFVEGAVEPLSKDGSFVGQHIATSRPGVAVQINAFNFPVWGPLEKLAPALVAGVPSLIKPATATAFLTARLVELIVASGILPEGSVQLLCGGASDLLDHVGPQDSVSFTGSAATARRLRTHPGVVASAARFNAEADSLNCSILGPDDGPGTPGFDLYVDQLVAEMGAKAGQKCTAIRRALVPAALLGAVADAAGSLLSAVTVGDPRHPGVTMGPLVSLEQRDEVRQHLQALLGAAQVVAGDPEKIAPLGGDPTVGAFFPPVLLAAEDADRPEPHEVEVFGPVATLIPYRDPDHAVELAARGAGSLAGSVVTSDTRLARRLVLGLAPWHGRILVLDPADAATSTGHGAPLPGLIHGGPGRAGGGEELGGVRAILHHLQRTAVQAAPHVLGAVTGRWVPGSSRSSGTHPFRKSLAELELGDSVTGGPRVVTRADIDHFAEFTGDTFYAHTDEKAAAANPLFGGIVAHGYLVVSLAAGLFVSPEPGPVLANYGLENLRFLTPVHPGDALTVTLTAKQITPRDRADYGEVRWDADVTNQEGVSVARYDVLTLVAKS